MPKMQHREDIMTWMPPADKGIDHLWCTIYLNQLRAEIEKLEAKAKDLSDPQKVKFRAKITRELKKLFPQALAMAKEGKPALLRLIVRAIR